MEKEYLELVQSLGITPNNQEIYDLAMTHSSCNGANNTKHYDYERLEFLGDAIIGMVVSELCFIYYPHLNQGPLSMIKSKFICAKTEAKYCKRLGLDKFIRVGHSFVKTESSLQPLYEDVFEAFIGAIFIDQGLDTAHAITQGFYEDEIKASTSVDFKNPKNVLQEYLQADRRKPAEYRIIEEVGAGATRNYIVGVYIDDLEFGRGKGHTKKFAEIEAAKKALKKLAIK